MKKLVDLCYQIFLPIALLLVIHLDLGDFGTPRDRRGGVTNSVVLLRTFNFHVLVLVLVLVLLLMMTILEVVDVCVFSMLTASIITEIDGSDSRG